MRAQCRRPRFAVRFLTIFFASLMLLAAPGLVSAQSAGVNPHGVKSNPPRLPETTEATPGATGDEPGLHDGFYIGRAYPFRVSFDSDIWTKTFEYESKPDYEGFAIQSGLTIGAIEAFSDHATVDECLAISLGDLDNLDGFSNIQKKPAMAPPASAHGVDETMFTFDYTDGDVTTPYTGYLECRDLVKGQSVLRVELAASNDNYPGTVSTWSPLLSGIEVLDKGDAAADDGTPTPVTEADSSDDGIENVVGTTYTSPRFGFSISWPETYEPYMAFYDAETEGDVVWVAHGQSDMFLQSGTLADYPVSDCFAFAESLIKNGKDNSNVTLMRTAGGQPMRTVTDTFAEATYRYTINGKNGPADTIEYIRCQADPTGAFSLDFSFMTPAESYAKTQMDLQVMIDSIDFE